MYELENPMLIDKIRELTPTFRAGAMQAETDGAVPQQNIKSLQEIGFFSSFQPHTYGGRELAVGEYAEAIVELAGSCASTAWASALLASHAHGVGLFSVEAQHDVWGEDPDTLVSSSVAPMGIREKVDGGILLSGRFGWSSGCDHAQWALLGYKDTNEYGQTGPMFALVPRSDYTILDDWDSAALSGTGSKTLVLDNVFVPDYRCESIMALNIGVSKGFGSHAGGLSYLPFSPVFSIGFSCVALGIGLRACEVYKDKTRHRVRAYTGAKVAESAPAYMRLAESVSQLAAAHQLLRKDWSEMDACADTHCMPDPEQLLEWRIHQSYAVKMSIEAVDRLFAAAGGSSWFRSNEMQRLFRDVHICGSHAQTDFDVAAKTYGYNLMGLAPDPENY
ncbi:MAG: alkylation response protein AidB-like acyl-CoA dehydrogenase [Flavobacteriales bacterium]|jgi:alkylation response protein AidB-like acyl-CoA dehydrogenase